MEVKMVQNDQVEFNRIILFKIQEFKVETDITQAKGV